MNIFIIIVTFHPNNEHLSIIVDCILKTGCFPIIVDNSENTKLLSDAFAEKCKVIKLGENKGIAAAQNIGIEYAIKHSADIIGFFDQDSLVDYELIIEIKKALALNFVEVAAPMSVDLKTGKEYYSQHINRIGFPKDIKNVQDKKIICADLTISSGTFVKRMVFEKVGFFDESFFIDFVDIEWCMRCRKANIPIWIVRNAKMKHSIGNNTKRIGLLTVNVHSPYRTYYKVRNAFLLFSKGINPIFSLTQIIPALLHNFLLIFDKKNGREYKKYFFQAVNDGIRNRGGKYEKWH